MDGLLGDFYKLKVFFCRTLREQLFLDVHVEKITIHSGNFLAFDIMRKIFLRNFLEHSR